MGEPTNDASALQRFFDETRREIGVERTDLGRFSLQDVVDAVRAERNAR